MTRVLLGLAFWSFLFIEPPSIYFVTYSWFSTWLTVDQAIAKQGEPTLLLCCFSTNKGYFEMAAFALPSLSIIFAWNGFVLGGCWVFSWNTKCILVSQASSSSYWILNWIFISRFVLFNPKIIDSNVWNNCFIVINLWIAKVRLRTWIKFTYFVTEFSDFYNI